MTCRLCLNSNSGARLNLPCGHVTHLDCLRHTGREWHCPECSEPVGSAQYNGGEWYVGVSTMSGVHCCYKIDSDSKLVPFHKRPAMWYRTNGRLIRCPTLSLRHNIPIF